MSTIASRLREIANCVHEHGLTGSYARLRAIATELEAAPAADAAMPAYGTIPWDALVAAVGEAKGSAFEVDPNYYVGHQMCGINMNSLNRIVSKFVAALQAQIAELEARQVPDGWVALTDEDIDGIHHKVMCGDPRKASARTFARAVIAASSRQPPAPPRHTAAEPLLPQSAESRTAPPSSAPAGPAEPTGATSGPAP